MGERQAFVLVHGAWHGPWVWERTRAALAVDGYESVLVDLPSCGPDPASLGTLADDVAAIERAIESVGGPVAVVAHSYAGVATTQADLPPDASVVFVAAFVPGPGMSLVSYTPEIPPWADIRVGEGVVAFTRSMARDVLYHDLSEDAATAAADRLVLQNLEAASTPVGRASWQTNPSSYVVCTEDRSVPVELQRKFADLTRHVRELPSSHSPMLSRPEELARVLVSLL
jgi:pimeloyl-ACP methyl ester carboxylesterase